jgi:hypothetical protein
MVELRVEIFPDLCYSITEVSQAEGFKLIMVKPTIDELAALKEYIFNGENPKIGMNSLIAGGHGLPWEKI